jgi:hypothetical protein
MMVSSNSYLRGQDNDDVRDKNDDQDQDDEEDIMVKADDALSL